MSSHELRTLLGEGPKDRSTLGRTRSSSRSNMAEKSGQIAELEAALEDAKRKMEEQQEDLEKAKDSNNRSQQCIRDFKTELENNKLRAEVERL